METELEIHWQVSVTVPSLFEQASEQPPCLTDQLVHLKDAEKDQGKNNLHRLFLTILPGVRQTNPTRVFFLFFSLALFAHDVA